jgi:undecaprenyl diphosphate synthase
MTGPAQAALPQHIAIVMDGNGRWAKLRKRPRAFGHRAGVQAVRGVIEACLQRGVPVLTLFAFSSENWARPPSEVRHLMDLFLGALKREARELGANGVRVCFIGGRERFSADLQAAMREVEAYTTTNHRLTLNIAVNYGGRWDIVEAARKLAFEVKQGLIEPAAVDADALQRHLSLGDLPEPDLFIRTGGETRISNFLLWHIAYTELYFTPVLWPDFDGLALDAAIAEFGRRERRFGRTGGQVRAAAGTSADE